jgi:transposase
LTTKILALVDALDNLVCFRLMPGQRGGTTGVAALIEGINFGALLGDKAYDADWLRSCLRQRDIEAVIPPRAKQLTPAAYDAQKYK